MKGETDKKQEKRREEARREGKKTINRKLSFRLQLFYLNRLIKLV